MSNFQEQKPYNICEPNNEQKQALGKMLHCALLEIRVLGWENKAQQAADLADAFHNLPTFMYSSEFDWSVFRYFIQTYQTKYPRPEGSHLDYVTNLSEIEKLGGQKL